MKTLKSFIKTKRAILLFVGVFAVVGITLLIITKAATPSFSIEPENGQASGSATQVSDATASGGKAIKFGSTSPPLPGGISSQTPCIGQAPPQQWKHVVVLMFENHTYTDVVGASSAPYINSLVSKCGTAYGGSAGATPTDNWHDGDYKVDGSRDGNYNSKPSYTTLASGLSPTAHGILDNTYSTVSNSDNIYNQLRLANKTTKNYYSGSASSSPCSSARFSGDYHDPMRHFSNLGGQSSLTSTFCNTHDVPISTFITDLNSGSLPAFSMIIPTNQENMHDNSVSSGDTWAKNFLDPIFNSQTYINGDTAVFFLWDEDTPIPNVLIAPSIKPGSKVPAPSGSPISHFSATRTWSEMLGLPLLGVSGQAPSLLGFFNGQ